MEGDSPNNLSVPKPRPKIANETKQYELCRRLEEYAEYANAVKHFSNVSFYLELVNYIGGKTKGIRYCDEHGGCGFMSDCVECKKTNPQIKE